MLFWYKYSGDYQIRGTVVSFILLVAFSETLTNREVAILKKIVLQYYNDLVWVDYNIMTKILCNSRPISSWRSPFFFQSNGMTRSLWPFDSPL